MEQRQPNELDALRADAQLYMELKGKKKALDDDAKEVKEAMGQLEQSIIDRMIASEFDEFKAGGYKYSLRESVKPSVPADKREAFFESLREHGMEGLIKESIDPRTLAGFVTEQMKENLNGLPGWIEDNVSMFTQTKLSTRKA